ncbi:hypothetical protein FRC02_000934 [Tulasnella sp. 418]|nr:hypothetical protein FRC02_000934 [Tulasnella sp. 418]
MGIDVRSTSQDRRDHFIPATEGSRFTKASARKDRASEGTVVTGQTLSSKEKMKKELRLADVQNTDCDVHGITNNPQSPLGDTPSAAKIAFDTTPETTSLPLPSPLPSTIVPSPSPARAHFAEPTDSSIRTAVEDHYYRDAVSKPNDQLSIKKIWWILEIIPMRRNYQDEDGRWHKKVR